MISMGKDDTSDGDDGDDRVDNSMISTNAWIDLGSESASSQCSSDHCDKETNNADAV